MNECIICKTESVVELLDVGMQPISNRFAVDPAGEEYLYPMVIGQCNACGLIQIINPVPASELLPPYEWIRYNEAEGHLDKLVDIITLLSGITKDATICGISYKEDSTLARLRQRGFNHTWRIDTASDLGITDAGAGIETIQDRIRPDLASVLWQKYGAPDVVIARHILEHAHDTPRFMETLHQLVKPTGYVVFEVPDCTRVLETFDYTTIWEEHILYFTPETFRHCFGFGGFSLVRFECYPYPYENSLVGIVQPQTAATPAFPSESVLENEKRRAQAFAQGLLQRRHTLSRFFSEYRENQGKVAMFGAGHLACMFINLMELKDYIEFIVDDDSNKKGLFMPGSRLPIYGSDALIQENINLCLTSLSPESEEKVIQKNQAFLDQEGKFASIFPASQHALQV
ncbi:methyltransferase domain-containing protein [bacterium]|nr:methyltransferase domain-containing protein [bacterium]